MNNNYLIYKKNLKTNHNKFKIQSRIILNQINQNLNYNNYTIT